MKTTIDLPGDLIRKLKLRALHDRKKFKDLAADMLRRGLDASQKSTTSMEKPPLILKDKKTGLPVIQCRRAAPPGLELTPERVAELLGAQEVEWSRT